MPNPPKHLPAVLSIYTSAFYQGLALICLAASASVLKEAKGFSDAQYGVLFLPQIITTLGGSLAGGTLARRWGLKLLLGLSLTAMALSQAAMGAAVVFAAGQASFHLVLAAIALLGFGFGIGAAPLNTYPGLLFPEKKASAIVAIHTMIAFGLASGPLIAGPLIKADLWIAYPLVLIVAGLLLLIILTLIHPPIYRPAAQGSLTREAQALSPGFGSAALLFCSIAVLYCFAEGTFSNWIIIYLREDRQIGPARAALALSAFWAALACGRLLISAFLLRFKAETFWLLLPVSMATAFFMLPAVRGAFSGIVIFSFAGLTCSAFFPITVGLFAQRFPDQAALAASLMIAAGMVGVSVGSFIVGPLRALLPLSQLYMVSAIYPCTVLVMAIGYLVRRRRHLSMAAGAY